MKTKNGMHICLATSLVLGTSMQVDVHSTKASEGDHVKAKVVKVNYVEADYQLEDQQILETKTEVRKQEYIRKQKLIEEERKRKEREKQREQQRIAKDKEQNKQVFNIEATAYTSTCYGCSGITFTGYNVKNTIYYNGLRIIATDNSIIPLYSIVQVEARNETFKAIVLDRGGGIKGFEADVLVENENVANQFGRQNVKVTVIRKGKGE